jgi:hypothetical protein
MAPQISVQRDALLPQAKVWDQESAAMGKIAAEIGDNTIGQAASIVSRAGGQVIPGVGISQDYPLFSSVLSAYGQVCTEFGSLCKQGEQMMAKIAEALTVAYQNYSATEQANASSAANAA